jgi:hypothetical protein
MILRHKEVEKEMLERLKSDRPVWCDDDPAVVDLACRRILQLFFGEEYGADDIGKFLDFVELAAVSNPPVDRLKAERIIRDSLGESDIEISDISAAQKFRLQITMTPMAAFHLELDEARVDEIIADSELLAFERGWHPLLVKNRR